MLIFRPSLWLTRIDPHKLQLQFMVPISVLVRAHISFFVTIPILLRRRRTICRTPRSGRLLATEDWELMEIVRYQGL
ncbi:MAG: hypothetical protein DWI22_18190 [Planctomycetota bacterium]|nr:MAG: hypothetical protein DWI22_18190 [Planctomycetota bacterium]